MAKHSKLKIPKRIGGIRMPRSVRKGPLGKFLRSGAGQVVVAETLMAAAATLSAAEADSTDLHERLGHAFRQAGKAFHMALQDGDTADWQDDAEPGAEPIVQREEFTKKKSSGRKSSDIRH